MAVDSDESSFPESVSRPHDLLINVLGASFSITTGEDPDYLNEVLEQYRLAVTSTQGISGMKDPLKVAILTGFLLCDEINKLKLQIENDEVAFEKALTRTKNLLLELENIIERSDSTYA